jgi:hypothetical protein
MAVPPTRDLWKYCVSLPMLLDDAERWIWRDIPVNSWCERRMGRLIDCEMVCGREIGVWVYHSCVCVCWVMKLLLLLLLLMLLFTICFR